MIENLSISIGRFKNIKIINLLNLNVTRPLDF